VIVGAGIAGLACARELASCGREAVVLERSRGVGGRCATRRVNGQPVDHGHTSAGTSQLTLGQVEYEPGDIFPKSGLILLETASGHSLQARIITNSAFVQSIELSLDDRDLVIIPILSL
jgi:phytoene dehydrogenase-like protein